MIGKTISHYHILEKLGEGGMGIVFKAQDTKLNRTVAIKMLPDRVNKDETAKARFLQEAQAAAGLNHPNICTVHGVEEVDGSLFMVMEYVEGGTLRSKIPYAKPNDAITVAIQIGDALQEAHAKDIVHRDIKADNVMLNAKGQAKVMDFGLAKLKGALKLTRTSSTVGTLGYMAPEQIQGGEVDHRSDIFSFGVLLFEMLTGKLPFRGEHEAAMMYSILNEPSEAIQTHIPDASPDLAHILNRALEKDPEDRHQSIADTVSELRRLLKQSSRVMRRSSADLSVPPVSSATIPNVLPSPDPAGKKKGPALMVAGAAAALICALAAAYVLFSGGPVGLNPGMTTRVLDVPTVEVDYPGLSSDGNWITFTANTRDGRSHVYLMNTEGGEPRPVVSDSSLFLRTADLSFDASKIVFNAARRGEVPDVYITSALGGGTRVLAQKALLPRFQPDGKRVYFIRASSWDATGLLEIWSIAIDGADERRVLIDSSAAMGAGRISLSVSKDNRSTAWLRTFEGGRYQEVIITDVYTGEERQLTFDKKNIDEVCWASNDQIIFSSNKSGNTNLWTVPAGGGTPVQITKGSGPDLGIRISADNSRLLYYQNQRIGDIWIGSLSTGRSEQVTADDNLKLSPRLSPDGKQIAFVMTSGDVLENLQTLYVINRDGTNRRALTTTAKVVVSNLVWSPDGRRLAYAVTDLTDSTQSINAYIVDIERPGIPKLIGQGGPYLWQDGDRIMLSLNLGASLASIKTGGVEPFFEDSTVGFPVPGGTHVFYRDHHIGREGRYVVRVDAQFRRVGEARKIMDPVPFGYSQDRDFVIFLDTEGLWRADLPSGQKQKLHNTYPGLTPGTLFTMNSATKEIVYNVSRRRAKLVLIENPFK